MSRHSTDPSAAQQVGPEERPGRNPTRIGSAREHAGVRREIVGDVPADRTRRPAVAIERCQDDARRGYPERSDVTAEDRRRAARLGQEAGVSVSRTNTSFAPVFTPRRGRKNVARRGPAARNSRTAFT